jgi:hypothetical protein
MGWKNIKKQAIINELDKMLPGERKKTITDRYCIKCWRTYAGCECQKEEINIE